MIGKKVIDDGNRDFLAAHAAQTQRHQPSRNTNKWRPGILGSWEDHGRQFAGQRNRNQILAWFCFAGSIAAGFFGSREPPSLFNTISILRARLKPPMMFTSIRHMISIGELESSDSNRCLVFLLAGVCGEAREGRDPDS